MPVQVSLAQQTQNGKSGLPEATTSANGTFQNTPAGTEPVMIVAECLYSMFARQVGLVFPGFRNSQIVEAHVGRHVWLIMAGK